MDGVGGVSHADPMASTAGYSPGPEPSPGAGMAGALRGGSPCSTWPRVVLTMVAGAQGSVTKPM